MNKEGFVCNIDADDQSIFKISWKDEEPIIPTITTSDLIDMGYHHSQFDDILFKLKLALVRGEATIKTKQSQIIWIKGHFVLK